MASLLFCTQDTAEIGEAPKPCYKPIKTKSPKNRCDEHLARLPIWPVNDDGSPCTPTEEVR